MLIGLFVTERLKYRRSMIPWLALFGGFFPALVAALFVVTGGAPAAWDTLMARGVEFFNMLALLLTAVIAGNAFVMEYHDDGTNRMHLYPVPRWLQYGVKLLVAALYALMMHLFFLVFLCGFGLCFAQDVPATGMAARWVRLMLLAAAGNLLLLPIAALAGIVFRKAGAYILWGIGCFVIFMSFAGSDIAWYVPQCLPMEILTAYLRSGEIVQAETAGMFTVSAAISAVMLCAGAVSYIRMER